MSTDPPWSKHPDGLILHLSVIPNSKHASLGPLLPWKGRLRARVPAPAVGGKANRALVHLVAVAMDLPISHVELRRGERDRDKDVLVRGDPEWLIPILERLVDLPG